MSEKITVETRGITRRTFLKGAVGTGVIILTAEGIGALVTSCAAAPTADFTVTSSTEFNHSHKITVLGADVDRPPTEKAITSDGATHSHAVTLTRANFQALKKGQEITLTSNQAGTTPHSHTFVIKVAAA